MKMEEVTGGGERGGSSSGTLLSLGLRATLLQVLRQEEEEEDPTPMPPSQGFLHSSPLLSAKNGLRRNENLRRRDGRERAREGEQRERERGGEAITFRLRKM